MPGGFKVHRGRASGGGGGGAPDQSLSIRSLWQDGQSKASYTEIDLSGWLATIDDTNLVSITVTGSIPLYVWPLRSVTSSTPRAFVRRELANMLLVNGNGFADGATGTFAFSSYTGANGTGTHSTYSVAVTVSNAAPSRWRMGAKSLPRQGGPPLSLWGAISITTIKDSVGATISTNLPFEVFGGRLVWKAAGSPTVAQYGRSRVVPYSSGIVGTGKYTVIFNNGASVVIDVIDKQFDVSPTPTSGVNAMSENPDGYGSGTGYQLLNAILASAANTDGVTIKAGDRIVLEDGTYNPGGDIGTNGFANALVVDTGVALPTDTMTATTIQDLTQPGWLRITARNPLTHDFGGKIQLDPRGIGAQGAPLYFMYEKLNVYNLTGEAAGTPVFTYVASGSGAQNTTISWIAMRWNRCNSLGSTPSASVEAHHHFYQDNYFVGVNAQGMGIHALDTEVIGNFCDGGYSDWLHLAVFNSVTGSGKSKVWWNYCVNRYTYNTADHNDFCQIDLHTGTSATIDANPSSTWEMPSFIGNMNARGTGGNFVISTDGQPSKIGTPSYSTQFILCTDAGSTPVIVKMLGNHLIGDMQAGLILSNAQTGSIVRDNGFFDVWGQTPVANALSPLFTIGGNCGTVVFEDNYAPASVNGTLVTGSLSTGGSSSNVMNLSTQVAVDAAVTNGEPGVNVAYIEDYLAAIAPKVSGPLFPSGKNGVGPVASGNYDHRRRIFAAARLS